MTAEAFKECLDNIYSQQDKENCKIEIPDLIDKDHLDPLWYGGTVGTIKFEDGYTVLIEARGDVRINGCLKGEEFYVVDKNNSGLVYTELGKYVDDFKLYQMTENTDEGRTDEKHDYIEFMNNNWFEFNIVTPDNEFIDCYGYDNVLDDDLLDCFSNISMYKEIIEDIKQELAKEQSIG